MFDVATDCANCKTDVNHDYTLNIALKYAGMLL